MAVGYVLINVKPGMELQAFEVINTIQNVAAADLLFGDYDIIVKISAENMGLMSYQIGVAGAVFESMSGLTRTGATMLEIKDEMFL